MADRNDKKPLPANPNLEDIFGWMVFHALRDKMIQLFVDEIAKGIAKGLGGEIVEEKENPEISTQTDDKEGEIDPELLLYKEMFVRALIQSQNKFVTDVQKVFKEKNIKSTVAMGWKHYLKDIVNGLPEKGVVKITSKRPNIVEMTSGITSISYLHAINPDNTYTVTCSGDIQNLLISAAPEEDQLDQEAIINFPNFLTKDAKFLYWGAENITLEYEGIVRQIPLITTRMPIMPFEIDITMDGETQILPETATVTWEKFDQSEGGDNSIFPEEARYVVVSERQFTPEKTLEVTTITCDKFCGSDCYTFTLPEGARYLEIVDQNPDVESARPFSVIINDTQRSFIYTRIATHENRFLCSLDDDGDIVLPCNQKISLVFFPAEKPTTETWGCRILGENLTEKKALLLTVNTVDGR